MGVLTIIFSFFFSIRVSYILEKYSDFLKMKIFSDLGYNENIMKIVVLSPYRSATQSTDFLLKNLGYTTIHYAGHLIKEELIKPKLSSKEILDRLSSLTDNYDAFSDNPFPVMYEYFDTTYPGSKFIMIKRDPHLWYESILQVNQYLNKPRLDPFERIFFETYLKDLPSLFGDIPYEDYITCYNRHIDAVESYFVNKNNLITLDISDEKKGIKIANFLDKDFFPKIDFIDKSPNQV